MVKKIIAVLLLVGFLSYALWQGLSPNEASDNSNLSEYKDLNIKKVIVLVRLRVKLMGWNQRYSASVYTVRYEREIRSIIGL
ncbi:hypothetical protein AAAC51_35430 [Priestia megaterium]